MGDNWAYSPPREVNIFNNTAHKIIKKNDAGAPTLIGTPALRV